MSDGNLHGVLQKLKAGFVVADGDSPDNALPGLQEAIDKGLARGEPGGGWAVGTLYELTEQGHQALGRPPRSWLARLLGL